MRGMKKVILGTGLMICGVLGIITFVLTDSILNAISVVLWFRLLSIALLIFGIILNIVGFFIDYDDNPATDYPADN